jgi:hypothetical protein
VSGAESRSRALGVATAALLCVGVMALRGWQNRDVFYDRFNLPAFDGHVYAAMAEEPRVFTIAPWGYRLLMPWLVHVSPWNAARGFGRLGNVALLLTGLAAFAMLRRLGSGAISSALAAAALLASDPVARIVRYRLLVEPLTLLIETVFLLAVAARVPWPVLALVGVLGTASKEFFLLLLPVVFLARLTDGWKRAALETAGVIAPSLALTLVLRYWWTPYLSSPPGGFPPIVERLRLWALTQPGSFALLAIVAVVAGIGAVRAQARPWKWAFVYVATVAFAAPFLNPSDFSAPDLPRLHVYVLPPLLPFVLLALDRVVKHVGDEAPIATLPKGWQVAAFLATAALVVSPFLLLDRYRRVDLRGDGDAARVLATCRGTLMAAERLTRGETVEQQAVRAAVDDTNESKTRWYVREGWEARADGVAMTATRATLIVPARPPRATEASLVFGSDPGPALRASLDGRALTLTRTEAGITVRLPANALVRGDNLLTLERDAGSPAPQLQALLLRPLP